LAARTERQYQEKIAHFFPLLDLVADDLVKTGVLKGVKIGWHCHLTEFTTAAVKALAKTGAQIYMSECNPATSDDGAIELMKDAGAQVYCGKNSTDHVLDNEIELFSDTGFVLVKHYLERRKAGRSNRALGACEITTTGITRLNQADDVDLPVININCGALKHHIENFHGVGEGVTEALAQLISRNPSGMNICLLGYGRVGAGCAFHLRRAGALVTIVEKDPVRELIAHFDGFRTDTIENAIRQAEIVITATGEPSVVRKNDWLKMKHRAIVMNVGHLSHELDLNSLEAIASTKKPIGPHLCEYQLQGEDHSTIKSVYICANGHPANVVLLTGSIEPIIIHLATELMTLKYLKQKAASLQPGEIPLPYSVEQAVSLLALHVLK
jgi:adenosylhomocysteinase